MLIHILTLMPDIFSACNHGVLNHAIKNKHIELNTVSIRDFTDRKDKRVDDRAFGGGPGMVLEAEPLMRALESIDTDYVIELTPQGTPLNQALVRTLSKKKNIALICGRYEGIDQRLSNRAVDLQLSIGDYVLSGGDIPALVLIDALARLQPGVINNEASAQQDSFEDGLLDHPSYTRPRMWRGSAVPETLIKGNHQDIADYRKMQSLGNTWLKRPDLLIGYTFNKNELALLRKFVQNHQRRGREDHD